jgi:hypothetical protein
MLSSSSSSHHDCPSTGWVIVLPREEHIEEILEPLLRLHSQFQHGLHQQLPNFHEVNHNIATHLRVFDHVDVNNYSGWLLGLMSALEQQKVLP